jgi:hypothetical protein
MENVTGKDSLDWNTAVIHTMNEATFAPIRAWIGKNLGKFVAEAFPL